MRLIGALLLLLLLAPGDLRAQALVVDLSRDLVAISTGFTGDSVTLFGATDGAGDVAITVRGPASDVVVRRKEQVAGMWLNVDSLTFGPVPGFFEIAASRPLQEIAAPEILQRHQIGLDHLALPVRGDTVIDPVIAARYRDALIRNKQRDALYPSAVSEAFILGNRLFRTTIEFPSNVPTGLYQVDTFLIRDGQVVDVRSNSLVVSKVGFSADVFEFAYEQAAAYALVALLLAVAAGFAAWAMFRER